MRKLKIILLHVVLLTSLNANAYILMTSEDVAFAINNFPQWRGCDSLIFSQTLYGDYDGVSNRWIAPINRSDLPTLFPGVYDDYNNTHTGVAYGFALIFPDPWNEDHYQYYDLGYNFFYGYNSLEDYEGMYGIYQILQDEPEPDPEAGGDIFYTTGAYFSADLIWYPLSELILIVYR